MQFLVMDYVEGVNHYQIWDDLTMEHKKNSFDPDCLGARSACKHGIQSYGFYHCVEKKILRNPSAFSFDDLDLRLIISRSYPCRKLDFFIIHYAPIARVFARILYTVSRFMETSSPLCTTM